MQRNWLLSPFLALSLVAHSVLFAQEIGDCNKTQRVQINLNSVLPVKCVSVIAKGAEVVLDREMVERHVSKDVPTHPDDDQMSTLSSQRAGKLLASAISSVTSPCSVVGESSAGESIYYVALMLERGSASVIPSGENQPVTAIFREDYRSRQSKPTGFHWGFSARNFRLRNGKLLVSIITSWS